ncbi:MAG: hypothetical protein HYY36_08510 [Gammaproteobacteria bacterium]|nr:hypothetical protein [Gammaproteobacteria bacterium]
MPLTDWIACIVLVTLVVISVVAMSALARRWNLHPEIARKSLHVSLGLVTLVFPWIFTSVRPVLIAAAVTLIWFALLRLAGGLRTSFGYSLFAVKRESMGEIHFVLAVCATLILSRTTLEYLTTILILTVADTAAAMVGARFSRHRYRIANSRKSLEGSAAFFSIAMAIATAMLWTAAPNGVTMVLGLALSIAAVSTLAEAVGANGLDNLAVPAATLFAFRYSELLTPQLIVSLSLTAFLCLYLRGWPFRRRALRHAHGCN